MEAGTVVSALAVISALTIAPAAAAQTCTGRDTGVRLTVQVGQLKSDAGEVVVTVYPSDPSRFLAPSGKLLRLRVAAMAPMTEVCFSLPKPDAYAVAVYHDADGDKRFSRNSVGLPTEGYGFSNDAPTRFGVPAFDAARFEVRAGGATIRVKMRYGR